MIASHIADTASYKVDTATHILETAAYDIMAAVCPARVTTWFLTTANGKLAGYLYVLTAAYWLENTPKAKLDTYTHWSITQT
jgi:hypothetical protein